MPPAFSTRRLSSPELRLGKHRPLKRASRQTEPKNGDASENGKNGSQNANRLSFDKKNATKLLKN